MFDYKQRSTTDEYRNNYDAIFNMCRCKVPSLIFLLNKEGKRICPICKKYLQN